MGEELNIQWFPGHMAKARRMVSENARLVDAVCEVIDARIPESSRNPEVEKLSGGKPRLLILNRIDQADPVETRRWSDAFRHEGFAVLETDSKTGKGVGAFTGAVQNLLRETQKRRADRGLTGKRMRVMVLGIPNVGKSSFINRVAGKKAAHTSDKPGVTRGKQWIVLENGVELLDTPGLLWPKFEDPLVGERLAFTGAVKDEILDTEALAARLIELLWTEYPDELGARYGVTAKAGEDGFAILQKAARRRGFLLAKGELDTERMSHILLDEFRGGKLGRITLERVKV